MKLFMSGASPFARKVRVVAAERGLLDRIEPVLVNPHDRGADLVAANPLSKVPTLVTDAGEVHCDSLAICIYLDGIGDAPPMVPLGGADKFAVLQRHVLANGAIEASVTRRVESLKSPVPDRLEWMDRQRQTTNRVLDWFEGRIAGLPDRLAVDTVSLACALTYLDFRFPDDDWRSAYPNLSAWLARVEERPSMAATRYA